MDCYYSLVIMKLDDCGCLLHLEQTTRECKQRYLFPRRQIKFTPNSPVVVSDLAKCCDNFLLWCTAQFDVPFSTLGSYSLLLEAFAFHSCGPYDTFFFKLWVRSGKEGQVIIFQALMHHCRYSEHTSNCHPGLPGVIL